MELIIDVDEPIDKVKGTLIRCRKCGKSEECADPELAKDHVWCNEFEIPVTKDWFCGDGERRTE